METPALIPRPERTLTAGQEQPQAARVEVDAVRWRVEAVPARQIARPAPMADVGRRDEDHAARPHQPGNARNETVDIGDVLDHFRAIDEIELRRVGRERLDSAVKEVIFGIVLLGIGDRYAVEVEAMGLEAALSGRLDHEAAVAADVDERPGGNVARQIAQAGTRAPQLSVDLGEVTGRGAVVRVLIKIDRLVDRRRRVQEYRRAVLARVDLHALVRVVVAALRRAADRARRLGGFPAAHSDTRRSAFTEVIRHSRTAGTDIHASPGRHETPASSPSVTGLTGGRRR